MASPSQADTAGRVIAGLLTYNPGPGIYSRMERAVEALPENVRAQELPGLLKRYKDGIPGWELKAVDLDSVVAGRDVVPRSDILAAVKERSPVYTHREALLGGAPPTTFQPEYYVGETPSLAGETVPVYQRSASPIGKGVSHGEPRYEEYGQGGENYSELLIMQPESAGGNFGSHWSQVGQPYSDVRVKSGDHAVAHARYDTHGDALRINELQSDLGIHNRKMREQGGAQMTYDAPAQLPSETDADYAARLGELGYETQWLDDGNLVVGGRAAVREIPFPLEDAWADILIKRLALEAARQGHRAIEVASPRAIADKVGGNIDNYEHFYGKVVPGAIERLGRKMGGVFDGAPPTPAAGYADAAAELRRAYHGPYGEAMDLLVGIRKDFRGGVPAFQSRTPGDQFELLSNAYRHGDYLPDPRAEDFTPWTRRMEIKQYADELYQSAVSDMVQRGASPEVAASRAAEAMPRLMRLAEDQARNADGHDFLMAAEAARAPAAKANNAISRRYIMSDEMRRRILTEGIPASVAIGIGTDAVLDRLDREAPKPQMR